MVKIKTEHTDDKEGRSEGIVGKAEQLELEMEQLLMAADKLGLDKLVTSLATVFGQR